MSVCKFSEERLQRWMDGYAADDAPVVEAHVEECADCAADVAAWRAAGEALREHFTNELDDIDPLRAAQAIHRRIEEARRQSPIARLRAWWGDVWAFHRQAVLGVAVAAALGAVVAPTVIILAKSYTGAGYRGEYAAVELESMEYDGNATAAVFHSDDGNTTLIWIEPGTN